MFSNHPHRRPRRFLHLLLSLLMAASTIVVGQVVVGAGGATAAVPGQGLPFDCTAGTIYNVQRGAGATGQVNAIQTPSLNGTAAVNDTQINATLPTSQPNGFGISPGGATAFVVGQYPTLSADGSTLIFSVFKYTAASQTWQTFTATAAVSSLPAAIPASDITTFGTIAGAVDPNTGFFYWGYFSAGGVLIFGYNTTSNTSLGLVATSTVPEATPAGTNAANGDFSFDRGGNVYIVSSIGTNAASGVIRGPLPTTAQPAPPALLDTVLNTYSNPNGDSYNGIAFDNFGHLFLEYIQGTTSSILEINPNTGALVNGPAVQTMAASGAAVDLAACSLNPSLTVRKNVVSRAQPTDEFTMTTTGSGVTSGNTATTAGSATGIQSQEAGPVIAVSGDAYTITETAGNATTRLASYSTTYACVDAAAGNRLVASGTGRTISLNPFPNPLAGAAGPFVTCTFTNTALVPALTVSKAVSPVSTTPVVQGQSLTYTLTLDNSAGTAAAAVAYTDDLSKVLDDASVTAPPALLTGSGVTVGPIAGGAFSISGSVAAGATATVSYTVTVANPDVGDRQLDNFLVPTGTVPPTRCLSTNPTCTTNPVQVPALTLTKSVTPSTVATAGSSVTYLFLVTNTGNVPLSSLSVTDTAFSGTGSLSAISCPVTTLAAGAATTCTATYAVTQADVNAGTVTNTATASGTPPSGPAVTTPPSTAVVTATPAPALTLVKSVAPSTVGAAGDVLSYSFTVTNSGNVTLSSVSVADTQFSGTGTLSPISCPVTSLAPGASTTCTATYAVTQADVDAGTVTNTATATGTPPSGPAVTSPPSTAKVTATPAPALTIVKTADKSSVKAVGEVITYSFVVTNTGNVTLASVAVIDTQVAPAGVVTSGPTCPVTSLAPGASTTCTATYAVTQADLDNGSVNDTAVAEGTPPTGPAVTSPPSTASVPVLTGPAITIVKSVTPSTVGAAGDVLSYSFTVTNSGNVTLSSVSVADTQFSGTGTLSPISCPVTSLAPGASTTCTATYAVTQADVDAGTVTNTATATGTPPSGPAVTSPPSTAKVTATPAPALTIVKTVSPATVAASGDVVTYHFLVTNTGNVSLTSVTVNDTQFSGTGTMSPITCPVSSLAPGASTTCTATYAVTQADVDAGTVTNTATATGTPPSGAAVTSSPSTAVVTATPSPALTIVKSANVTVVSTVGQIIGYSFTVTNTGSVSLSSVSVIDTQIAPAAALTSAPICPVTSLAPGASTICTATYTVTQADLDNGSVDDSAVAAGTPPSGPVVTSPPSTVAIPVQAGPALSIVKSVTPTTVAASGDVVTYHFLVTNTGNVSLTSVTVNDTQFSGTGTMSPITCPVSSLAPGASTTCTATYAVTQADVDAGTVTNTATATGTPPQGGSVISGPSTATVTATPAPLITIKKTVDRTLVTAAGQMLTYQFAVTNIGNVTLHDVVVHDEMRGLSAVACPTDTLAPGAAMVCTATYIVTSADLTRTTIPNTATSTGLPPGAGKPVVSPPSSVAVPIQVTESDVAGPPPTSVAQPQTLASTGASVSYVLVLAGLVICIGGLLMLVARDRRGNPNARHSAESPNQAASVEIATSGGDENV